MSRMSSDITDTRARDALYERSALAAALFYAWPADGGIPLIDALFPDPERLRSAWEVRPLLSRGFRSTSIATKITHHYADRCRRRRKKNNN